jgi:hypothetical protein
MNNKILIGSITAICILLGVSFTSVVGYRSVASEVKSSPLFNIRSSRAIDDENEDFSCEYVGKGEENILRIPNRKYDTALIKKVFDRICKMEDEVLEKYISSIINYAYKDKRFNVENPDKIREALYLLRYNDKPIPIFDYDIKYKSRCDTGYVTGGCCFTFSGGISDILFCILIPFLLIWNFILILLDLIWNWL